MPDEPKRERGDLDDPKKVGRKALLERLESRQRDEDTLYVLSTVQGRRFYWGLMGWCGLLAEPFTGNNTTFYNIGRASVARKLFADLERIAPDAYLMMVKEAKLEAQKKE